ncbi:DoxX family protein [Devosia sp. J2-20]|uniref:DoxX family protein n=1 Tax=Devosia sp. J2-20 TaxID=3026161 RepID=UPI002499BAB9|nr:DoxX family protein [Devosia sp. J2-20]WDQ99829.1 DoxX family protein [Devosia sp. J2-20]
MTDTTNGATGRNGWNIGLWLAQALLALMYGFAGFNKLTQSMEALGAMGMSYALDYPEMLTRFIGTVEVLGAIGLILPALTRILPRLTPLAAVGFSVIQVLAMGVHISRAEFSVLPMNLVLLALSLFIVWGRTKKAPISPR